MTTKVSVQMNLPVVVEVEVKELTEDGVLDAVWFDARHNLESTNWEVPWDRLKGHLKGSSLNWFDEEKEDKCFTLVGSNELATREEFRAMCDVPDWIKNL